MKRAPIVIAGTVVGLIGVLKFHTAPVSLASPAGSALPAASASGASPAASGSSQGGKASGASAGSASQQSGAGRSAVGPSVYYDYGTLSVRVTVSGHRIVKVALASLDDGSNARSQFIDQQSIPMLEQEVLQAQSANIQGVSGASYTSAGFAQSLQGALHSLGFA
ncbi:MAG TPA: FMN-binding protein [Streptosporangiaceae bacterium]|nr:FMN-binding protein [Streptosporangiaceae bacterium]